MDQKQQSAVLDALADLVSFYGQEDNASYLKRLKKAELLLEKVAPGVLRRSRADVRLESGAD